MLDVNLSTVIELENGSTNKFNGAYGNSISYMISTGNTAGSSEVVAAFYSEEGVGEYLAINIKYHSYPSDIPTVSQLESAVESVDGFTIKSSGEGDNLEDIYSEGYIVGSFTGGEDAITVTFSEDIDPSTVDTTNINTDFNFASANVIGTSIASNPVVAKITESDYQILGDTINVKPNTIKDSAGNNVDSNIVTIID